MNIDKLIIKYNTLRAKNHLSASEGRIKDKIFTILKDDPNIIYEIRNQYDEPVQNFKELNKAEHFLFFLDSPKRPHYITLKKHSFN